MRLPARRLLLVTVAACGGGSSSSRSDAATASIDATTPVPDATPRSDGAPPPIDAGPPADAPPPGPSVMVGGPIGTPQWAIVGCQNFVSPMGTLSDSFAEQLGVLAQIMPSHKFYSSLQLWGPDPSKPHTGYDTEIASGVASSSYVDTNVIHVADFVAPSGLLLACMLVPTAGAPTGPSPDGTTAILPASLWPIYVDADLAQGGVVIDPDFDSNYPAISTITPAITGDYSHLSLIFGENTQFIAGTPGAYQWRVTVTDGAGNGYHFTIDFRVDP
jgi:hypothetical protein